MADDGKKSSIGQFGEDVAAQFKIDADTFLKVFDDLSKAANSINNTFGQARARVSELRSALADAGPDVLKLGGNLENVADIIGNVAEASRRNVVATSEEVEKLFAAQKVLGLGAKELGDAFLNVGMGIETIPKTLEDSVEYIQSIGGNAKSVMRDVTNNMEQMNRYQFEGGVQGLTKMAAQASMLRFDMSNTFAMAEKVLSPEGAIEVASAFQRLGVAAGNLADPFALMNQSINDPSGLQDSLANVSKQFTYFDEKTKTFKISPQGVLTLREMEREAGLAQGSLSKMGLAAAEADKRIQEINKAGLTIINEEDKQYLSNIAKMEEGTYKVTLEDGTKKELAELTQPEFNKLIEEQKNQPKSLEEIAKAQMTTSEVMMGDLKALRNKFVGGVVTAQGVQEGAEGARRALTTVSGVASNMFDTKDVRRETQTAIGDLSKFVDNLKSGNMSTTDALADYLKKAGAQMGGIEEKFKNSMTKAVEEINKGTTDKTIYERMLKEGTGFILDKVNANSTERAQNAVGNQPISSLIEGRQAQMKEVAAATGASSQAGVQNSKVEMAGAIKIDITAPPGFSDEKIQKLIYDKLNEQGFKDYIISVTTPQNSTKAPVSNTYSR